MSGAPAMFAQPPVPEQKILEVEMWQNDFFIPGGKETLKEEGGRQREGKWRERGREGDGVGDREGEGEVIGKVLGQDTALHGFTPSNQLPAEHFRSMSLSRDQSTD